jgi:hypothetical protein
MQTDRVGSVQAKSDWVTDRDGPQYTVHHGPNGMSLDRSNSKKFNSSHVGHRGSDPHESGMSDPVLFYFYKLRKTQQN